MYRFGGGVCFRVGTLSAVYDAAHLVCPRWDRDNNWPNAQSKMGYLPTTSALRAMIGGFAIRQLWLQSLPPDQYRAVDRPGLHDRRLPLGRALNRNDIRDRRLCSCLRRDPIDEHRRMGLIGFHWLCWQCHAVTSGLR